MTLKEYIQQFMWLWIIQKVNQRYVISKWVRKWRIHFTAALWEMEKIFNMQLYFDPVSLVLGIECLIKALFHLLTRNCKIFSPLLLEKNILLNWIIDKSPSLTGWHKIIFELIPLERLTYVLHQKTGLFYKVWTPYLDYMDPHLHPIILQGIL